jgi:DNA-binding NtrC family response regulator
MLAMSASSTPGPLLAPADLSFLEPISRLYETSPFDPAWGELEREAIHIGRILVEPKGGARADAITENLGRLSRAIDKRIARAACALVNGTVGTRDEIRVYRGAALYALFEQYRVQLQRLITTDAVDVPFYDDFVESRRFLFGYPGLSVPEPAHLLALFYQARRAWWFASSTILGAAPSAAAARLAIWRANMAIDPRVYADDLYRRMDAIPVLITGETGTGKDLAATCVGRSRYIPFDVGARRFVRRYSDDFHVKSLCEVPGELLASALFGHKRGSFTGATTDEQGLFGLPKPYGSLFLDEVGEMPEHVQAKLLRPLQNREYVPIGETAPRPIHGRLIFATHRDLEARCREGSFRDDLFERMNGFPIQMPSLRQMLAEAPGELRAYVRAFVATKVARPDRVETWTERVVTSIQANRPGYAWPRNLRELSHYTERCILGDVHAPAPVVVVVPATAPAAKSKPVTETPRPGGTAVAPESTCLPSSGILGPKAKAGEVTLKELEKAYVTQVHVLTDQNIAKTARLTGVDRRTVLEKLDLARLARWLKGKKK